MTAQLMAFKLSDYIWLIVFVGFIVWFAAKDERVKNIGQTVFAFGLLFVGIDTMGAVMKPLAQSEVFLAMIDQVKDIPALGVAAGTEMCIRDRCSRGTIWWRVAFTSKPSRWRTAAQAFRSTCSPTTRNRGWRSITPPARAGWTAR